MCRALALTPWIPTKHTDERLVVLERGVATWILRRMAGWFWFLTVRKRRRKKAVKIKGRKYKKVKMYEEKKIKMKGEEQPSGYRDRHSAERGAWAVGLWAEGGTRAQRLHLSRGFPWNINQWLYMLLVHSHSTSCSTGNTLHLLTCPQTLFP